MRKQSGIIFIQIVSLYLLCSLSGLLTVQAMQEGNTLPKVQTHTVLVENASPTW